ncbi:hypothetical protein STEG23_035518 [Scotinomys teguina]
MSVVTASSLYSAPLTRFSQGDQTPGLDLFLSLPPFSYNKAQSIPIWGVAVVCKQCRFLTITRKASHLLGMLAEYRSCPGTSAPNAMEAQDHDMTIWDYGPESSQCELSLKVPNKRAKPLLSRIPISQGLTRYLPQQQKVLSSRPTLHRVFPRTGHQLSRPPRRARKTRHRTLL